jgi:cyclopropane-fatty-acyl-phospholipid synthase
MLTALCKRAVVYLFQKADVVVGRDITVRDETFYYDVATKGSLGLGESYTAGKWSSPNLVEVIQKLSTSPTLQQAKYWMSWLYPLVWVRTILMMVFGQSREEAREVGKQHYDLSTTMYEQMLGTPMQYSCAVWKNVETLGDAQLQKMELLCRKLGLNEGERVLDIGCGWGDLAIYIAKEHGCFVTGITISEGQRAYAEQKAIQAGVEDRVTFMLCDYRDHNIMYDKIVSVGMLEHCTRSNLPGYFQKVHDLLRPGGLAVIHSITKRKCDRDIDPWISKYIFPNSAIPSNSTWVNALRLVPLEIEDVQNIGPDYAKTLHAWYDRYRTLCNQSDPRFSRMWQYYLNVCEAQFLVRELNVWQMVLSKERMERYDAPR